MQVGGISRNHGTDSHQVTNCMHDHVHMNKEPGAMSSAAGMSMKSVQNLQQQQETQISLTDLMKILTEKAKGFFRGLWGSSLSTSVTGNEMQTGQQMMVQPGQEMSVSVNMDLRKYTVPGANPYFQTVQDSSSVPGIPLLQRVRRRIKGVAGQLAGKLPGGFLQFQNKNPFQAKSGQKPDENLRRRSKYRKDDLEIDCVLTDESYLMDSYDRKGEYRRLTTKK